MGLLMAAKYSGRLNSDFAVQAGLFTPTKCNETSCTAGQFWALLFCATNVGKGEFLLFEENCVRRTILLSRLQSKVPHPQWPWEPSLCSLGWKLTLWWYLPSYFWFLRVNPVFHFPYIWLSLTRKHTHRRFHVYFMVISWADMGPVYGIRYTVYGIRYTDIRYTAYGYTVYGYTVYGYTVYVIR